MSKSRKNHRRKATRRSFKRIPKPGTPPGVMVVESGQPRPRVHILAWTRDAIEETSYQPFSPETLDTARRLAESHEGVWIDVDGLGDGDLLVAFEQEFQLHPLAMEDVVNVHQRAKAEDYGDHLYVVCRMLHNGNRLETEQVSLFLRDKFVLTFQERPGDCFEPLRQRIRQKGTRIRERQADFLVYCIVDTIIDHYFPIVDRCEESLDRIDEELTGNRQTTGVHDIHQMRSDLLFMHRALRPHREMVNQMLRDPNDYFRPETEMFLRDCYDHIFQLSEAIETNRQICSDLRDFHLTSLSNRTNEVMKTLTIISTIFIPLGFIAGLYGMNFAYMPELQWRGGYFAILAVMAVIAISLLGWFWKRGWFSKTG